MQTVGFINSFDELADSELRLGRKVANYGMVAALLEHSTADELHFFLPFAAALKPFERAYAPWLEKPGIKERVRLIHTANLPAALERGSYLAFHAAELDRYFPELCHLRNHWALEPFPVTCTTHTLSYWSTQVRNLYKVMPGPASYDSMVCTSRAAKQFLEACLNHQAHELTGLGMQTPGYSGRLDIIPLGINCRDFKVIDRHAARNALGIPPERLVLLCVGRLSQSDKFDLTPLVGALSLLRQKHDLCLVLAGAREGSYAGSLQSMAAGLGLQELVHIFADFDSSLKSSLYSAADIFVSPSDNVQETFGLTILEAMAAGLPVVASDFSGYRDLVEEGQTGFLIPTLGPADYRPLNPLRPVMADHITALHLAQRTALDLDFMLARIQELAQNPEMRRSMGEAGRKRVLARFDWKVVIAKLEALWRELKAQAMNTGKPTARPDICGAGLGQLFGHFMTQAIHPSQALKPGPFAQAFSRGEWASHPLPDLAGSLPLEGMKLVVQALSARQGVATLASLTKDLQTEMPDYLVEHLVLHGLKYGIFSRDQ
jgi:glycosyltransferase involved in cell wall biosynthesis